MTDGSVNLNGDSSSISPSLLDRVQARDAAAWRRFVELFAPLVYGWCRRARLQEADAADVGQEVFRAVYRGVGQFRRDRPGDSFRAWLRTITRGKLCDFLRRRRLHPAAVGGGAANRRLQALPSPEEVETATAPHAAEEEALRHRAIALVRAEFTERHWLAFWRVAVEGEAAADVANDLGITSNVVYLSKSRILARFRQEFAHLLAEERKTKEEG
jgi:RNA polymerase sigma-70 factor (ECF subfamily)